MLVWYLPHFAMLMAHHSVQKFVTRHERNQLFLVLVLVTPSPPIKGNKIGLGSDPGGTRIIMSLFNRDY
jgi:hypothetical protein